MDLISSHYKGNIIKVPLYNIFDGSKMIELNPPKVIYYFIDKINFYQQ